MDARQTTTTFWYIAAILTTLSAPPLALPSAKEGVWCAVATGCTVAGAAMTGAGAPGRLWQEGRSRNATDKTIAAKTAVAGTSVS